MTKVKDGFYKQVDSKQGDDKYALLAGGGHSDLSKIYTKKIEAIPFVIGKSGTAAGTWTGDCADIDNYYDGLSVIYIPVVAGASTTTLNINNLGAKTVYYTGTSKLTTHYGVGSAILLTYYNDSWRRAEYNSDNNYLAGSYYARYKVNASGYIGRYMLVMKCPDGTITGLCLTNNSTATNKTMFSGPLLLDQVYYMSSTGAWAANANMASNLVLYENISLVDVRYTFNCGTGLTTNAPFYIVFNKGTDGYYYLDTTIPWHVGVPTTDSNKIYLNIGSCYDSYRVALEVVKKAYQVKNGKLIEYHPYADNASFADNAVTASSLTSTDAYKAWGQTFFNNGIPVTHNGSITDVENITPLSNAGYSLGSSAKRWLNIYGRNLQSDTTLYLDSAASTSIILRIGGVEKARFCQPNGYLCIGVTSPSYSIHTSGTIGGNGIYANIAASGTANGLSLYSNSAPDVYGIAMRNTNTTTFAKIGKVQGDWATFFTMNDTTNRGWIFRSGTTSYASISTRGEAYFPSIGKDGYIPYPGGGKYTTTTSSITGAICIELPVSWTRTMLKFEVDIYNYSNGTSVTYVVGGYNYDSSSIWFNTTAYSLRQGLNGKGNLTVRFGHNGTHCCVYIGETTTTWEYPQVVVRNFHAGYNNYEYNRWASGWVVSFVTTLGTITSGDAGTITNPAVNYNSDLLDGYHASGLFTVFSGGGISSSGNTLTQADHSITIGGTNKTAGSSTASIINSNSLTGSTAKSTSASTYNLSLTSTINGVASTKSITKLWASYIDLQDIRGTNWAPNHDNYPQKSIVAWFNSTGTPASDWYSGITVKGWTNDYASWQLAGYSSSNTTKDDNLYFRNGINGTWKAWKTILDSNNSSVSSTANSITVKINGTTATLTNTNTDTLVNQSQTTTSNWRPVILGYQSSSKSSTELYTSVTNVVYTTNVLQYQPSTGLLSSTRLDLTQATGTAPMTIASTTLVSNLNTDMVDGYHASSFFRNLGGGNSVEITVNGDANTYYPVVIGSPSDYYPYQFVNITRAYSEAAPDTWNTSTHKGGLSMAIFWNGSKYWDGNASGAEAFVVRLYQSYCTMVGGVSNSTGGKVIWLRGGGAKYHVFSMNGKSQSVTVYDGTTNSSTYTDSASQSFAPKTTPDTITVRWPGYAQGADTATSATNITVTNNTSANANYPIVWSNQNNTNNANANQLYKSYDQLLYNPSTKILSVNKINLNRAGNAAYGRIYYWNASFYTWVDYMSNSAAGAAPTGGQPSTTTEVTSWAKRSLIENQSGYGWIWEACANGAASATSTKPTARMSLSSNTGQLRIEANAATTTNNKGSLIISSVLNGSSGNVSIELWRGTNASWSISNESGTLHIRDNYTTAAQTTFLHDNLQIAYNTGTITTKSIVPFTTNTYALGSSSLRWSKLYIGTADSYGSATQPIYWNAGVPKATTYSLSASVKAGTANRMAWYDTATSIAAAASIYASGTQLAINSTSITSGYNFQVLGSSLMRLIAPQTTNTYDLGSTSLRWKSMYNVEEYIGTASGSQCHLNFDDTNKCLRFTFD